MGVWLTFALLSPLLWAIVHLLDAHCVEQIFDRPWLGVITGSFASLAVFLLIPFAAPLITWELPEWHIVGLALLVGALIQLSQGFYFQALEHSEASIVAAYWNMTPILLPIASYILFDQDLETWHCLGMIGLVVCSSAFCLLDENLNGQWRSFFYMFIACCIQVTVFLLEEHVFKNALFFIAFLLVTTGIIISGFFPLLLSSVRKVIKNTILSKTTVKIIIAIEIVNLIAIFCSQQAIDQGIPSLVAAIETTIPVYTFLLSVLLFFLAPRFADTRIMHRFYLKLLLVSLTVAGVVLISSDFNANTQYCNNSLSHTKECAS